MGHETLFQSSKRMISKLQSIPGWSERYYSPMCEKLGKDYNPVDFLWKLLCQGGTLCEIANLLQKNVIPAYAVLNVKNSGCFDSIEARENVQSFLETCQNFLFIPETQLFNEQGLYQNNTSDLTKCIRLLDDLLDQVSLTNKDIIFSDVKCMVGDNSGDKSGGGGTVETKKRAKLESAIEEVLSSEKTYVEHLEQLEIYMAAVDNDKDTSIPKSDLYGIFSNLSTIINLQRKFLLLLEIYCNRGMNPSMVGEFFKKALEDSNNFRSYYTYCSNYLKASKLVKKNWEALGKYDSLIERRSLNAKLIEPIQRVCRYPLLLREIDKYTLPEDPGKENIQKALELTKNVADAVNENRRISENVLISEKFFRNVVYWGDVNGDSLGDLLLEDKINTKVGDIVRELHAYLFETGLVLCKSKDAFLKKGPESLHIQQFLKASDMLDLIDESPDSGSDRNTLTISTGQGDGKQLLLEFKRFEDKKRWKSTIEKMIIDAERVVYDDGQV